MTPQERAEIEALAQQVLEQAQEIPRVVTLTPLDQPDRGWCPRCNVPSTLEWQVVFELGSDFDVRTVSVCTDCGEESAE